MLKKIFYRALRVQKLRDSQGESLLESFAEELSQAGYAEITARRHIQAAERLIHWLGSESIPISSLTEKSVERFDRYLKGRQRGRYSHTYQAEILGGVCLFLKHLRRAGAISATDQPRDQDPALLTAFREWMRQQRGACDLTICRYSLSIRDLLKRFGEDPGRFDAKGLREFVLEKSQHRGCAEAKKCTTALRMFLRFLIAEGKCSADLSAAIPVLVHWRLSSLPRYLQPEEV